MMDCKVCGKNLVDDDGEILPWYNVDGGERLVCPICGGYSYICNGCYNRSFNLHSLLINKECRGCFRDKRINEVLGGVDDVSM